MENLSPHTQELIKALLEKESEKKPENFSNNLISVSNLTSGIEFFYEKIRNALEYREENLWLKDALSRILKRRFFEILAREKIGREIIEELIRGRYLENNYYPETKAFEIDEILNKYRLVFEIFESQTRLPEKKVGEIEEWFLNFASLEIVDLFPKDGRERIFVNFFWKTAKELTAASPDLLGEKFDTQLYLSVFRNFFKADEIMEEYEIFRLKYPQWLKNSKDLAEEFGRTLPELKSSLKKELDYPLKQELDKIMKRRSLFIFMLQDLIRQEKGEIESLFQDPEKLENRLREIYDHHYQKSRNRLRTSAIRAIIFIVLTKMALLFAIEVPFQKILDGGINYLILAVNTLIPPTVLIASSLVIKMPGEEQNFIKIVSEFERMIRSSPEKPPLDIIRSKRERSLPTKIAMWSIYAANVAFTGWVLDKIFRLFNFNYVDAIIFVLFLSLVSFFAIRLRQTANQLIAVEEKDHWLTVLIEFFFFPIIEIGKWISKGVSALNITAFIFDFLIETPFKTLIQILEEWFGFIRERRQNL